MPKKPKKEEVITNVLVYEEDAWYVSYTGTDGRKKVMRLDAETRGDAKFEAASLLDVPEESIEE